MPTRHAIQLFFDEETEAMVYGLFHGLKEAGISSYLLDANSRPHISIGIYNDIDLPRAVAALEEFCAHTPSLPVKLSSVGAFPNAAPGRSSTVFLNPMVTADLLALHASMREAFAFCTPEGDGYRPGAWTPHCTVDTAAEFDTFLRALEYTVKHFRRHAGRIAYVGWADLARPVQRVACFALQNEE